MTELETQIWNTVHNWCDAQSNEIPDQNRRYLMGEMKALVLSHVSSRFFIPESAQEWLLTGDRGISSETIFGAITGLVINRRKYPPADPADFYRCYKLINAVPEWKSELHKVAELSKTWK